MEGGKKILRDQAPFEAMKERIFGPEDPTKPAPKEKKGGESGLSLFVTFFNPATLLARPQVRERNENKEIPGVSSQLRQFGELSRQ